MLHTKVPGIEIWNVVCREVDCEWGEGGPPPTQAAPPSGFDLATALHLLGSSLGQLQRQSISLLVTTLGRRLV